tara:strand:- start:31 stop:279 length:249 start_codon:yes stop_codon:yes gene_type:complete
MNKEKQIYPKLDNTFPILISPQFEQELSVFSSIESTIPENSQINKNNKISNKTLFASIILNMIGITLFSLSIVFFIDNKVHY